MKKILFLIISVVAIYAYKVKTPSDVFSYAMLLKKKVEYLTLPPKKRVKEQEWDYMK